jgi:hypothetical protein
MLSRIACTIDGGDGGCPNDGTGSEEVRSEEMMDLLFIVPPEVSRTDKKRR